jgi:hypothetical protein
MNILSLSLSLSLSLTRSLSLSLRCICAQRVLLWLSHKLLRHHPCTLWALGVIFAHSSLTFITFSAFVARRVIAKEFAWKTSVQCRLGCISLFIVKSKERPVRNIDATYALCIETVYDQKCVFGFVCLALTRRLRVRYRFAVDAVGGQRRREQRRLLIDRSRSKGSDPSLNLLVKQGWQKSK